MVSSPHIENLNVGVKRMKEKRKEKKEKKLGNIVKQNMERTNLSNNFKIIINYPTNIRTFTMHRAPYRKHYYKK